MHTECFAEHFTSILLDVVMKCIFPLICFKQIFDSDIDMKPDNPMCEDDTRGQAQSYCLYTVRWLNL